MSIKSLFIKHIASKYTAEYIANLLWRQNIAQVSAITLIPYHLRNKTKKQSAYIEIATWSDSEIAYNFIRRLSDPSKETRLIYKDDNWWKVQVNSHSSIFLDSYTTTFSSEYFDSELIDSEYSEKEEVKQEIRELIKDSNAVIQGYQPGVYYSVKEANERCDFLRSQFPDEDEITCGLSRGYINRLSYYSDELAFLEEQLIEHSAKNSQNVTLRAHQQQFCMI